MRIDMFQLGILAAILGALLACAPEAEFSARTQNGAAKIDAPLNDSNSDDARVDETEPEDDEDLEVMEPSMVGGAFLTCQVQGLGDGSGVATCDYMNGTKVLVAHRELTLEVVIYANQQLIESRSQTFAKGQPVTFSIRIEAFDPTGSYQVSALPEGVESQDERFKARPKAAKPAQPQPPQEQPEVQVKPYAPAPADPAPEEADPVPELDDEFALADPAPADPAPADPAPADPAPADPAPADPAPADPAPADPAPADPAPADPAPADPAPADPAPADPAPADPAPADPAPADPAPADPAPLTDNDAVTALTNANGLNIRRLDITCDRYEGEDWFNKPSYGIYVNTEDRTFTSKGSWIWTCAEADDNYVYAADCPGGRTSDWDSCQ